MNPNDPNVALVDIIVARLRVLGEPIVLVGGCAAGLLITDPALPASRATADVAVVVEVATLADYHRVEKQVAAAGLQRDVREGAPICRWRFGEAVLDLMPSEKKILGFGNRWYPLAVKTARRTVLPSGAEIRLIHAPVFVAAKLDAFLAHGVRDWLMGRDLGDVLAVIDGRDELLAEFAALDLQLTHFVGRALAQVLATPKFRNYLPGHLPGDDASQARIPLLETKLMCLAALERGSD